MKSWLDTKLARLESLDGYSYSVEAGQTNSDKLDANENWNAPGPEISKAVLEAARRVDAREYPEGSVERLRRGLAAKYSMPLECFVPCNGADQAIDLLCQAFLTQSETALIVGPTFSMYGLRATVMGAKVLQLPMNEDFGLPVDEILGSGDGVLFICSPNNPSGNQFRRAAVLEVLDGFKGLVVLDEAYVEFADYSLMESVAERRNIAVLRTFSKAFGLAGLRIGYLAANESWAPNFLAKMQYPYPISSLAAEAALIMLQDERVDNWVSTVKREREWMSAELRKRGATVVDSKSNFLLVSLPADGREAHASLLASGVATRWVGSVLGLANCLRVTIGNREMNVRLVEAISEIISNAR